MDAISDKEKDLNHLVSVTKQLYERTLELQRRSDEQSDQYELVA